MNQHSYHSKRCVEAPPSFWTVKFNHDKKKSESLSRKSPYLSECAGFSWPVSPIWLCLLFRGLVNWNTGEVKGGKSRKRTRIKTIKCALKVSHTHDTVWSSVGCFCVLYVPSETIRWPHQPILRSFPLLLSNFKFSILKWRLLQTF